jgi:bacillithiol biosynthesis cysteine-adding enzyme BshC
MELIVGRPSGSRIVRDYLAGEASVRPFFPRAFTSQEDFEAKAAEVDSRFDRAARERAVEAIIVPPGADTTRLENFVELGGYMVTTGQQPALFGGPLYNLSKALTAVRLAEALESALGKPVIPVFWVASDDHDWAEANHTHVIGVDNELHRFAIDASDPDVHPPIHRIPLGSAAESCVEEFIQTLPYTEFSGEYLDQIRGAFTSDATLSQAFHDVYQKLLGRFGIFFTDAAHPAVKQHSAAVLSAEIARCEELETVLRATADALASAGYELQVPILEGSVNLFLEGPSGRERLYRQDGGFRLRASDTHLSADDVRRRQAEDPSVLSPNVLLRPVVESKIFPTLSYVGGPGEIAYFAQLGAYFEAHGLEKPIVYPRFVVTPVEAKIRKVLQKFGLDVEAFARPFHEVSGDIAREDVPPDLKKALGNLRGTITKGVGELEQAVAPIDPTLKGTVQHVRSHALDEIDDLEKKILQALKRENEIALSQLEKVQVHLFPNGTPAERVQNPFYFLTRYGGTFLDSLYEHFQVNFD